jgi:hypothetical protein
MRKATRILTMTGMALVAGLAFTASPAQAAPATPAVAKSAVHGSDRVIDHFRSKAACNIAGYRGERRNAWEDFDCSRVWFGRYRGTYALSVNYGWGGHGHGNWGDDQHNGNWGHGNGGNWGDDHGNGHGNGHGDSHGNGHGDSHGHGDGHGNGHGDSHGNSHHHG